MTRYLAVRAASLIPTIIGVSILVFLLIRLIPGDVVDQIMGAESIRSEESIAELRAYFGLDRPIYVQYWDWFTRVATGDLGNGWRTGRPVLEQIFARLPVTLELTVGAILVALIVGIPLGAASALFENSKLDHIIRVVSLFSLSIPIFFQAAVLILLLSRGLGYAPPVGFASPFDDPGTNFAQMALPCVVLGTAVAALLMRQTRASTLEVLRLDYIKTARAKGLGERSVLWGHLLKNSLIPVVTVVGAQVGYLLGGSIVTEAVFALPGIGRLVLTAVEQRDYPVVQGVVLFMAVSFMLCNLIVDLLYAYLDPRIGYQ